MTHEEAVQQLTPMLRLVGCRFTYAKKKRDIYQLGYVDVVSFMHRMTSLLNNDDPRWHGMAWLLEILEKWGSTMTTPNDTKMTQDQYAILGMERFYESENPLPMPEAKIDQMARLVLDKLQNP